MKKYVCIIYKFVFISHNKFYYYDKFYIKKKNLNNLKCHQKLILIYNVIKNIHK
jgi:hypothetical protein